MITKTWRGGEASGWTIQLTFPVDARVHVPGECGRVFDNAVPVGATWSPPLGLRASAVVAETDGVVTRYWIEDTRYAFQGITMQRSDTEINLSWWWCAAACTPPGTGATPPEMHCAPFDSTAAAWKDYGIIMNRLWPMDKILWPSWSKSIPGIVLIEMWASSGTICNTFDDLTAMVSAMKAARVPAHTLIHFWGWSAPYDTRYPDYQPAAELGGTDGMARFCDEARAAGYHPMPHARQRRHEPCITQPPSIVKRATRADMCEKWPFFCTFRRHSPFMPFIQSRC